MERVILFGTFRQREVFSDHTFDFTLRVSGVCLQTMEHSIQISFRFVLAFGVEV